MRNFQKLADSVYVVPLVHAITRQPELWNQHELRRKFPGSPHKEVDDIWLRFNDTTSATAQQIMDQHESINYEAMKRLPLARPILFDLMRLVEGERLGRVIITRLPPGGIITPHIDSGDHAQYYDRYHVTLKGSPGCTFKCGIEEVYMRPGEIWWFDNQVEHSVINNSVDDRITMIVDIRTTR